MHPQVSPEKESLVVHCKFLLWLGTYVDSRRETRRQTKPHRPFPKKRDHGSRLDAQGQHQPENFYNQARAIPQPNPNSRPALRPGEVPQSTLPQPFPASIPNHRSKKDPYLPRPKFQAERAKINNSLYKKVPYLPRSKFQAERAKINNSLHKKDPYLPRSKFQAERAKINNSLHKKVPYLPRSKFQAESHPKPINPKTQTAPT